VETGANAPDISGQTLRQIVHTSAGGRQARVWLSNHFGTVPLHIGSAHIAIGALRDSTPGAEMSAIQPGSDRTLTFNHRSTVTIAPGATVVSDGVALDVPALANIAVSLYFPDHTLGTTEHGGAHQTSYAATGDVTGAATLAGISWTKNSWYILSGVDVYVPGGSAIVALGDSITDGNHSTDNENHRWPDYLAARLAANEGTQKAGALGIVNLGISGNRLLQDGDGPNALSQLDWDVFSRSGVRYLILFDAINDIEATTRNRQPCGDLLEQLETGLAQVAVQAHQHGILVYGATQMTDSRDQKVTWPEGEAVRTALDHWILTTDVFDGAIDFDKTMRDPQVPTQLLQQYNSGDFVHPNDTGYKAMADSIDLNLFTK
jgi:lysophospholipase L1-like esterase